MKFAIKQKIAFSFITPQTIFKGKPPVQTQGYQDKIPINSHPRDCLYLSCWDYAILLEQPHQTQLFLDKKQIKESHLGGSPLFGMVLLTGLEPVRYRYRGILSPLRLPISPQQQRIHFVFSKRNTNKYYIIVPFVCQLDLLSICKKCT